MKGGEVMKANETVKNMLEHPFATVIILGAIVKSTVKIISAVKGVKVKPNTVITIGKATEPTCE
jgi:hypothetical protein